MCNLNGREIDRWKDQGKEQNKMTNERIMKRLVLSVFIGAVLVIAGNNSAFAESSSIRVYGTVTDSTNVRIPGAAVMFVSGSDTSRALTDSTGFYELFLDEISGVEERPSAFSLSQNYPNPFNPSTVIRYTLDVSAKVSLDVYSVTGQKVKTLFSGDQNPGVHHAVWNGRDASGRAVAAGVYFYRLRAGNQAETKKMLLLDGAFSPIPSAHAAMKSSGAAFERQYMVTVSKSTMHQFHNSVTVSYDRPEIEENFTLPDRYRLYTIRMSDSILSTYPGGGIVVIIEMTPSDDFEGSVLLSAKSVAGINPRVNLNELTPENRVTELIAQPDSSLSDGTYPVSLFLSHGAKIDTLTVPVTILTTGMWYVYPTFKNAAVEFFSEFCTWCNAHRDSVNTLDPGTFFLYAISNASIGGSGTYVAISNEWEIHFKWQGGDPTYLHSQFLLRRMGEKTPSVYLVRVKDGYIDYVVADWLGVYSHSWKE
jgi:hypothetical protein